MNLQVPQKVVACCAMPVILLSPKVYQDDHLTDYAWQ